MTLWDEIHEQPDTVASAIASTRAALPALAEDPRIATAHHVVMVARGTSDNAARYAKYVWGSRNRRTVSLSAPSLFGPYAAPPDMSGALVVAISQSGSSPDLIEVMKEARRQACPSIVITNAPDSALAATGDHVIPMAVGPERAVAATKSYTASLAAIASLSAAWSGSGDDELDTVPTAIARALALDADTVDLDTIATTGRVAVVGRGYNQSTAFELAIKMQELSQVLAHPYSSSDFRHGPLALVEPGFPMILINAAGALAADLDELTRQVRDLGADPITISNTRERSTGAAGYPAIAEWLSPMVSIISGQLITHRLTRLRGLDPDAPRTIIKVTKTH